MRDELPAVVQSLNAIFPMVQTFTDVYSLASCVTFVECNIS